MSQYRNYTVSIHYDRRLYRQDITGSRAHVRMLARQGIIGQRDAEQILTGLETVQAEIESGAFPWDPDLEDLHMNIETRLAQLIGPAAGRLHTGRSRNDQIALDLRLYTREVIAETTAALRGVQQALVDLAARYSAAIIPGYTHLQRAQPVMFAHHLLAYFQMLERDIGRFRDCRRRADVLPLGSGALAGVPYPTDRHFLAGELGFSEVSANSMDAVSDRDFLLEFQAAAAACMMHLSRLSEEIVLWSSREFGFISLAEEFTTGSSIMPQKRNPDLLELVRAKAAFVDGQAATIRAITNHLPSGYHRDLQQTKGPFLIALEEAAGCVRVMRLAILQLAVDDRRLRDGCTPELMATDRAYELVAQGMAFRDAYRQVGAELREAGDGAPLPDDAALAAALAKNYAGAPGNLALDGARREMQILRDAVEDDRSAVTRALVRLAGPAGERLMDIGRRIECREDGP
jgi:argininosuccinate lyase